MAESGIVARRAGIVALGTLASRVLGMLRESVIAALFAVGTTDAFFIAFTIPNTLRMLLGEGAVSNAFLPVFTDVRTREGEQAGRRFLARFSAALLLLLTLTCAACMLGAPLLALAYAGGLADEPERFSLVVWLTRWLFPFLALAGLAALASGALNASGRFAVPAFAPALFNVSMLVAPFALMPVAERLGLDPIATLVFGALIGGALMLAVQLGPLRRAGLLTLPELRLNDPDVRRALGLMAPLVLGLGVYQVNMLLSRLLASFLPAGAPSFLTYGQRVIEIPQGMFALAIATAALPTLSRLRSEGKHEELLSLFRDSLRLTLFVAIPSSVALIALSTPTIAVLLNRGAFGPEKVAETAKNLAVQASGVWAVAAVRTTVPMFAAHNDTRTPVKASAVNLLVFVTLSVLLMGSLGHVAIALANTVASCAQLAMLLLLLRRHTGPLGLRSVLSAALRTGLASLLMGALLFVLARNLDWSREVGELRRIAVFAGVLAAGAVVFFGLAWVLRAPELRDLAQAVRRRRRRAAL